MESCLAEIAARTAGSVMLSARPDCRRAVRVAGPARGQLLASVRKPTPELCTKGTGYVEDIIARTDAACLIDIHLKRISYQQALRSGRLSLEGPRS